MAIRYGRYGRKNCHHEWAIRADGYEEYCTPVICIKCGAFGCLCDARRQFRDQYFMKKFGISASLYKRLQSSVVIMDDYKEEEEEKKLVELIYSREYKSTDNINGKWKNPYVEELKKKKNKS
ncbi:MAG TPA: hypothetical protein PLX73_00950 [Candidatus Paceibacterota bacterium]|nr:hypothetical protein [Candidatus Paceibacterota bacterium]HOL53799.1 hypothetical protein [Candidatus Paceibacterota bacterium]HON21563.1 hypothetical protein [Candidatus Paceibacterota bacterium]HPP16940.1 hypothetical protein [Candidatus Paceibacterota bacterium]HRU33436.1 hypothetical protein [Candidatus Paceibacterota bacterium]